MRKYKMLASLKKIVANCIRNTLLLVFGTTLVLGASIAHAQTKIFVENNTPYVLNVSKTVVSGDKLNKKAWKQGVATIPAKQRESVLRINRSGKFNWMDPTPRFIEPGKTVVFSTALSVEGFPDAIDMVLKQKLRGEGKSSKLWHAIKSADHKETWLLDDTEHHLVWQLTDGDKISVMFRAYKEKKNTHIEYVFSNQ